MVVVGVVHFTSLSLTWAGAEVTPLQDPPQEDLSVPTVTKFTKEMFAQQGDLFAMDVTEEDILRQCAIHPGRLHSHIHPLNNLRLCKKYRPKVTRTLVKQKMST